MRLSVEQEDSNMKQALRLTVWALLLVPVALDAEAQWPLGRDPLQPPAKESEPSLHVTATGRFQIFVSPHVKGHTFMLDTDTGRVWFLKKDHTSGDFSMQRIPVQDIETDQSGKGTEKKADTKDKPSHGGK
jgi:hypothetical protein